MILTYVAFILLVCIVAGIAAVIVVLGSLPGKIARKREHPQADAINVASWISLAGFGIFWPLAFISAFLRPFSEGAAPADELQQIKARLASLESALNKQKPSPKG